MQSSFGKQLDEDLVGVLRDSTDLIFLVEALACGIVANAGYDPRTCWRPTRYQPVRIEYRMFDARIPSPPTERMVVAVDADGGLACGSRKSDFGVRCRQTAWFRDECAQELRA